MAHHSIGTSGSGTSPVLPAIKQGQPSQAMLWQLCIHWQHKAGKWAGYLPMSGLPIITTSLHIQH